MFVSDYIVTSIKGHQHFDFVDVNLDDDNKLFIDPCLLEHASDPWSRNAALTVNAFFDRFYDELRRGTLLSSGLLDHAREQNATKLGYGNGDNGKGKTAKGLWDSIKDLQILVHDIPSIDRVQDITILVNGIAEDFLSDLLTNILHEQLNAFTCEQMAMWGCAAQGEKVIWTFDAYTGEWIQVSKPCWYYNGKELLLVPKHIVRRNYLFNAHQYLCAVIIDRIRDANGWNDLKKIDIWSNLPRTSEHWEYDKVISYSREYPDVLSEYHERMPRFYRRANGCMTDRSLDITVYGYEIEQSA